MCKDRVDEGAAITPGYHYDIEAHHAVLHTATRDAYCASIVSPSVPSINGYFAYVLGNASLEDENMYTFYDRERYGVIDTFEPPLNVESQCGAGVPQAEPCIFPFKYRNITYSNCTIAGTSGAYGVGAETEDGGRAFRASMANLPWCATSLTATGEADAWRYVDSFFSNILVETAFPFTLSHMYSEYETECESREHCNFFLYFEVSLYSDSESESREHYGCFFPFYSVSHLW